MAFDDRNEGGAAKEEARVRRQLRISDLLRGPFDIKPVALTGLFALAFWGWMWGISGMILAVPILATFKIFCDHFEPMAPISKLMS